MIKFWGEHPVLLGVCILLGAGLVGAYWQAALFIAVVLAVGIGLARWMVWLDRRSREQIGRRWGLVRRADYEHDLWLRGDARGLYGAFPPYI